MGRGVELLGEFNYNELGSPGSGHSELSRSRTATRAFIVSRELGDFHLVQDVCARMLSAVGVGTVAQLSSLSLPSERLTFSIPGGDMWERRGPN